MTNRFNLEMERILRYLDSKEHQEKETDKELKNIEYKAEEKRFNKHKFDKNKPLIKCACCLRIVSQTMQNQLYCNPCNIHHKTLLSQRNYYKKKLNAINKFIYGQSSGSQRLQFNTFISPIAKIGYDKGFKDGFEAGKKQ
jgi:hypothetical protein